MSAPKWVIEPSQWDATKWCLIRRSNGGHKSIHFNTREEAEAELQRWRDVGTCRECSEALEDRYMEPYKTRIREQQLCFSCLFWTNYLQAASDPTHVIVGGYHYVISPDSPSGRGMLGHGGARFDIRFHDGRELVSHNLWAQGKVPEHFRDRLADNAVFVRPGGGGYVGPGSADSYVADAGGTK